MDTPLDRRTPGEVDTYLKDRFRPKPRRRKWAKESRWVTTCLTSEPTEDSAPKYADWEACASLFVVIDILTHADGIRHSGIEGEPEETAKGLLVLVACDLQYLHKGSTYPIAYSSTMEELTKSFSFSEIQKRTVQTRFRSVLYEIVSDKDALLNSGGLMLPFGGMALFLTSSPIADDTICTSLPKEIRLALPSHNAMFYNGGLILSVTSSVAAPPGFIFQMVLRLTLLCLEQTDHVPTPTERPCHIFDVVADVTPQGHAPWLRRLLSSAKECPNEEARPLPWLTPSLILKGSALAWLSAGNTRTLRPKKNLSFCPGAIINGEPQSFVVGSGAKQSYCVNLLLSIANPRVYHNVLHSGSDSTKEFGPHTFPKSVLQQMDVAPGIHWLPPFALPLHSPSGAAPARTAIPKIITIKFGAHRACVYESSAAAKLAPFAASAKDSVREAHARDFIQKSIQPKILDEEFPDYLKLLDDMATDPTPVTLPDLPLLATSPTASRMKRSRTLPANGEGGFEDIRAFGSGTHPGANVSGSADPNLPPPRGPTGNENAEVPPVWNGLPLSRPL